MSILMPSSKFSFFFFFFFINFLNSATNIASADPTYLYHNCSIHKNFTANSPFQLDRTTLLSSLASNATGNTDFYNATAGAGADAAYGLFMCRGDVNSTDCRQCVVNATQRISAECRSSKEAVIWYDECMLRYSNRSFFSTVDTRPRVGLLNTGNVSDQTNFMSLLFKTINETADEAAKGDLGEKKYATKEANISGFQSLYCLAQCTADLSAEDCRRCLSGVIGDFNWCCTGKQGGRVLYPSCNARYELYPFYHTEAPATTPTPPAIVPPANSAGSRGKSGISSGTIVAIVVPISVAVLLFIVGVCFLTRRTRKKYDSAPEGKSASEITTVESLQIDFGTIEAATDKFSAENKLGEGGFGEVYKGTLQSGQEIAVKRLSQGSGQGALEFKNEVVVVAKLQHRNLVRLLGFCLQGEEKILVYEYVPNKSLDYILFDPEKQRQLDWTKRYKIIGGIARGIQYLHEDSRPRIIHRDLKASNVLLDGDMNPKISDFGMAKIFGVDQTQGNTSRIAWKLWKDGEPLELLDPTLRESYTPNEVMRCIHIGLLCVQEDPAERPTMASIVLMLDSYSVTLPTPTQPAFFIQSRTDSSMPKDFLFDQSATKSPPMSVNEMSISDMIPRSHACTVSITYKPNTTFQTNLNSLLSSLSSNATNGIHYFRTTIAGGTPSVVNGLFLCRGDTLAAACHECVSAAAGDLKRRCPSQKEAIIWYDVCMLRYSNQSFNNIVPSTGLSASDAVAPAEYGRFNELLAGMLNSLAARVVNSEKAKFATAEVNFTRTETLFGLVQCTPELSVFDCNMCFRSAIAAVPNCCDGKRGARVLLPSCNIRYELYPFFNSTQIYTPPIIQPRPSGRSHVSIILGFVIPILAAMVLFVFGFCSFMGKQARNMIMFWKKRVR
ncbi:cysteine-rich receptor-like protein kinase 10 [Senna tora]|uniref:non-specific serine/threonine protein kinase n=1 Tax=Senna tora TaxID=362788 RepID=A0A834XAU5_9FABA|nr:cysteine-rich receptor-like protein kinase 10 [Senna tora]